MLDNPLRSDSDWRPYLIILLLAYFPSAEHNGRELLLNSHTSSLHAPCYGVCRCDVSVIRIYVHPVIRCDLAQWKTSLWKIQRTLCFSPGTIRCYFTDSKRAGKYTCIIIEY